MGKNDISSVYLAKRSRASHPKVDKGPGFPGNIWRKFWATFPQIIEGSLIGIGIYNFVQPNLPISVAAGSFYYFSGLRIPVIKDLTNSLKFKKAKKGKK